MGDSSKTFGKLKIALLLLLAICLSTLSAQAKYGGGTGGSNDPYLIFDANQMNTIGADANDWDRHFLLCADVDLGGDTSGQFSTIGTSYANSFAGVFDGNNHIISNLRTGLFGIVVTGGRIKNLGLIDPNIGVNASLVDRLNEGTIENCYVQGGSVDGDFDVGGLVAMNAGTITSCYSSVSVWGLEIIGGLVGVNEGTITNCYSTGAVSGYIGVGGLCGANDGTITACYSISEVSGDHFIGGLVAMNWSGTITDCYSTGNLSGYVLVGGLVGENGHSRRGYAGTIINCYSAATFTETTNVGGLVGINDVGTITGSFWDTDISDVNNMCGSEGSGGSGCDNNKGKTTAQMKTESTFTDAGWDFSTPVWTIDEGLDYPKLWWETYYFSDSYGGGTGSPLDPFLIYDANQMNAIGANPNDWDKHFKLMADIDLSSFDGQKGRPVFNIIGYDNFYTLDPYTWPFSGVFDGNGYKITNFSYSTYRGHSVAIFGYVDSTTADIRNVLMVTPNVYVPRSDSVGALVGGLKNGTVRGCSVEGGSFVGDRIVGGLVGWSSATITNCYSNASAVGVYEVGGLAGVNEGSIEQCYAAGTVSGSTLVGGLTGKNITFDSEAIISNSYATGRVTGSYAGGLVGKNRGGSITNCYSKGRVVGLDNIGGLIGETVLDGVCFNCFWDIQTSGLDYSDGGIGKTKVEMQTQSTFTDAGWDFVGETVNGSEDIWRMCLDGVEYPRLSWEFYLFADFVCPDGVDFFDFSFFSERWAEDNCAASNDCDGRDLDQLGSVDINDLRIFADNWLKGF